MDNSVLDSPDPEKQTRLIQLHEELEGLELLPLLHKLMERFQLSANQTAAYAGVDPSAFSKILNGENREFKAEQVDKTPVNTHGAMGGIKTNAIQMRVAKRIQRRWAHIPR